MNYNNLIIIKDNLIYYKDSKKEQKFTIDNKILKDSKIVNTDLFIKNYLKILKENRISTFFWNKKITIIYDSFISLNDLKIIENSFTELNYKSINLLSDINLLKINKKDNYLIIGNTYKLYYIDNLNVKRILQLNKDELSIKEMYNLIKNRTKNKNLFVIGKNFKDNLLKNLNYYVYDSFVEFFFNLLNEVK